MANFAGRAARFLAEHVAKSALTSAGTQLGEAIGKRIGAAGGAADRIPGDCVKCDGTVMHDPSTTPRHTLYQFGETYFVAANPALCRAARAACPVTTASEWTLATVRAAAEDVARGRVRAFLVNGTGLGSVRIEVLRDPAPGEATDRPGYDHLTSQTLPHDLDTRVVTWWLEIPCDKLDAADATPGGAAELVEREVTQVVRMRHGQGAAA